MSCSSRASFNRPSPLEPEEPSRLSVLPATVYCPDDDEPSSPTTSAHFSGLFRNSFASSSSSYCSRGISPPITPSTEVYHGRRVKRKVSRANMRASNNAGSPRSNQARLSKYAAQTPCSTPDTPLSLFDNFCADVRAAVPVGSISDFQAAPPQPEFPRPSTAPELSQNLDERPASPRSSIVLGIGMKYPQPSSSHPSHQRKLSRKCTFPVLGDWEVSDDDSDTLPFELVLKPWMPLQVVRKTSAPAILSTAIEDGSPKHYSSVDPPLCSDEVSSSRLYSATGSALYSNDISRPSRLYSATDPSLYSSDNSSTPSLSSESAHSLSEVITGGEAQVMSLTQPIYRQSIVDVAGPARRAPFGLSDRHPTYTQPVVEITSSASTPRHPPLAFGDHLRIEIPERSPSAPIVVSASAVPFDTSENFPAEFSELPANEAEIFNLVMSDVMTGCEEQPNDPEYPSPRESQECTIHPAWNELSEAERNTAFTILRKKELERLANLMIPESPTTMSFRSGSFHSESANSSAPPSPSTAFDGLAIPSPASFRPNSRWSDYSVDEDTTKEGWRASVFNHLHLPNVGIDLKKAVAAAKGGIINRRRKVAVEALVEEESASIRGTPSPRHSTATDTDSIVDTTIIASLPPSSNRISASSGSSFKLSRIASPSIKPGKESKSTRRLTTSSDEDGGDDEASKSKGPGIKGVFGRYVVPHAKPKRRKDEKRREELKKQIRVVGGGKGGDWI